MKEKLVVWGASHQARVVLEIVQLRGEFRVVGLLDDVHPERAHSTFAGYPVLGGQEVLPELAAEGVRRMIFGFGNSAAKFHRIPLVRELGFSFVSTIHPAAVLPAQVEPGEGTVIKAGAVVDPGVRIGAHVILGANSVVTHGSLLEDGVRLAAGAILGSSVVVARGTLVGINAVVLEGVRVGAGALVGAGAVVTRDVPPGMVVAGNPARVLREAVADDF